MPAKVHFRDTPSTGHYMQQRPWTPTKPRKPVAAEFVTPGPACIVLPSTMGTPNGDSRKSTAPAFSFRAKIAQKIDNSVPGPGEYEIDGVTHHGKDWSQKAFLSPRIKDPAPFQTPAPGSYNVEKSIAAIKEHSPSYTFGAKIEEPARPLTPSPFDYHPENSPGKINSPSYSFGVKLEEPARSVTPAPCDYETAKGVNYVSTHENAPCYSIAAKIAETSKDLVPGPGAYKMTESDKYKGKRQPAYSLGAKTELWHDKTQKPAPSDYQTEKVWINKACPPRFTFGVKHSKHAFTC